MAVRRLRRPELPVRPEGSLDPFAGDLVPRRRRRPERRPGLDGRAGQLRRRVRVLGDPRAREDLPSAPAPDERGRAGRIRVAGSVFLLHLPRAGAGPHVPDDRDLGPGRPAELRGVQDHPLPRPRIDGPPAGLAGGLLPGRPDDLRHGRAGCPSPPIAIPRGPPAGCLPAPAPGLRHPGVPLAVSHMGAPGLRRGPHADGDAPCGRAEEVRALRAAARRAAACARRRAGLDERAGVAGPGQPAVLRPGGRPPERARPAHRLFERGPHGLHLPRDRQRDGPRDHGGGGRDGRARNAGRAELRPQRAPLPADPNARARSTGRVAPPDAVPRDGAGHGHAGGLRRARVRQFPGRAAGVFRLLAAAAGGDRDRRRCRARCRRRLRAAGGPQGPARPAARCLAGCG